MAGHRSLSIAEALCSIDESLGNSQARLDVFCGKVFTAATGMVTEELPLTALLGRTYNGLSAAILQRVVASGFDDIRPSHGSVFEQLTVEDGLRLKELAARASMTPQSMGELVDELEDLGYVERRPDPNDRRAKRITLTRRGRSNARRGLGIVTEIENELEETWNATTTFLAGNSSRDPSLRHLF